MKTKKQRISAAAAKRLGDKLGVDWAKVDLDQFRRGLEVELKHGARDPQTNVTNNDMEAARWLGIPQELLDRRRMGASN